MRRPGLLRPFLFDAGLILASWVELIGRFVCNYSRLIWCGLDGYDRGIGLDSVCGSPGVCRSAVGFTPVGCAFGQLIFRTAETARLTRRITLCAVAHLAMKVSDMGTLHRRFDQMSATRPRLYDPIAKKHTSLTR